VPCLFSSVIKKFCYASAIVNVPEAVNLAILSPPGCVDNVRAGVGLPDKAN
jgi:hypothetical protein